MASKKSDKNITPGNQNKAKRGMSRKARNWLIFILILIAAGLLVGYLRIKAKETTVNTYETVTIGHGPLLATIGATGNVRAKQTAILTWQTSGTIGTVNVKAGNQVKEGDILVSLLQDAKTLNSLESALVNAQENLAALTSPEAIANARLAVTSAQSDVINAKIRLNNQEYWQNDALIKDQYAAVVLAKEKLDNAQAAYDDAHVGQYINNVGEASLYRALYNAQQAYNAAFSSYSLYSQKPTQRQLDEAQANMDLANATLTSAQNYLAALTGGDVPADATGTSLLKLKQAQLAVQTATLNLEPTALTAPFNGIVTEATGMVGDQVSPGTSGFRVDDLSHLLVDVQVSEVDINNVKTGQPVAVTFDAALSQEYHGKVTEVSKVGTLVQSVVNFSVTVELTDPDENVKPGMTASVTITIQSLENVLLVPNRAVHLVDSQRIVYVLRNGALLQVPVTLGASDDTMSEVLSGDLSEGDVLVLNPPPDFTPGQGGGPGSMFGGG